MKLQKEAAKKIKAARIDKKLSQYDIAEKTGINQGNFSRMENGQKDMQLSTLERIADALGKEVKIRLEDK